MSTGPSETEDAIALSGLQHLVFCERQAALIHIERVWQDNGATAEGNILHERADLPGADNRRGVRVHRAVQLRSDRLGIAGRADVVEYHADASVPGGFRPFPVEYSGATRRPTSAAATPGSVGTGGRVTSEYAPVGAASSTRACASTAGTSRPPR